MLVAGLSVVLIGVLELLQLFVPGRHARLEDFVVDALAACIGFAIVAVGGWLVRSRWRRRRSKPKKPRGRFVRRGFSEPIINR